MNPAFRSADPAAEEARRTGQLDFMPLTDPAAPGDLPAEHLDAWLDRLVDGEIDESQRRALLARLEGAPEGWRRCALAFLEAQAWREALESPLHGGSEAPAATGGLGTRDIGIGEAATTGTAPRAGSEAVACISTWPARRKLNWRWGPVLGMMAAAASFAAAFGLGLMAQRWLGPHRDGAAGSAVQPVVDGGAPGASRNGLSPVPAADIAKSGRWGTVQFVMDGPGGTTESVRLPAIDVPDPAKWLQEQPPAIPDEVIEVLRRHGHHVRTERQYVPVPLDDGRSALFPIDQVEVRFRGGRGYQ